MCEGEGEMKVKVVKIKTIALSIKPKWGAVTIAEKKKRKKTR